MIFDKEHLPTGYNLKDSCHPKQVNAPALTSARQAGTPITTHPEGMEGWVDPGVGYIPRWCARPQTVTHASTNHVTVIRPGVKLTTSRSQVRHPTVTPPNHMYTLGHKNVPLYFCPHLRQLLTNFQNSFTGTLCRQFAIMWLLYIPPHGKCVSTLPYET